MNILLLLTPKNKVAYIYDYFTVRQALEKMEFHRYTSIPILNEKGGYVGTLTEGDLLWEIKNEYNLDLKDAENIPVKKVPRHRDYQPVTVNTDVEDLIQAATNQNFIPVLDDKKSFIGIVTRGDIIQHCYNQLQKNK